MNTVRARVSHIGKEASGQLALDVEIPLLHIAPLRIAMTTFPVIRSQVRACSKECETRDVGGIGSQSRSERSKVTSRWREDSGIPKGARLHTGKTIRSARCKDGGACRGWGEAGALGITAAVPIHHRRRSDERVVRSVEWRAGKIHEVVVR